MPISAATPPPARLSVEPARHLRGRLRMPPDKSISHRALLLAAMAEGESLLHDASAALDPRSTAACLRALGVDVQVLEDPSPESTGRADWRVHSPGWPSWSRPAASLDCGNSGTTLRLLAGLLAGLPLDATLDGDASLRSRPVRRVIEPLQAMGATLTGRDGDRLPPLRVVGRRPLRALDWATEVPSAQVKSAILLAGLGADGVTTVREAVATRDHTERMLRARGVAVVSGRDDTDGTWAVSVEGGQTVRAIEERVPGDASAASFWLVAGAAHPDAQLTLEGVGVNPTRRAALDALRAMGAQIEERPADPGPPADDLGEPVAALTVWTSALQAIELGPADVARTIDELPVLCLAAACARGTSRIRGAGELRHKESDRLVGIVDGLSALGARVRLAGDDLTIEGGAGRPAFGLRGGAPRSLADHRLAMTFAVAGLLAAEPTTIDNAACVAVSYPTFFSDLERVRA
ncbi:MAG: 3-phosphoshikimate 1-carboxyvinyltransferase [Candidatus Limnocylindrales bacterium]